MKTSLPAAQRAIAAGFAIAITAVLFTSVVSISEPQRSVLMAKSRHSEERSVTAEVRTVVVASNGTLARPK